MSQNNIPKIIHYFWFGDKPLPELAKKCIASWRKYLPDYEIKLWNESNFDVNSITYTKQAYEAKKYAFVSDYARLKVLYQEGGVYFDTDVEVIKSFDDILLKGAFMGLESIGGGKVAINSGLGMATPPGTKVYKELVDSYENDSFIDKNGRYNLKTVVTRVTDIFQRYGFVAKNKIQKISDITIYPTEYFCPKDFTTGKLDITEDTYSIHWYDASWLPLYSRVYVAVLRAMPPSFRKRIKAIVRYIKGFHEK